MGHKLMYLLTVVLMSTIISLFFSSCDPREQREKSRHVVESTIVEQKPQLTPVIVATELINTKKSNIELDKLDSVFKTIPDEIIIFICNDSNLDLDTVDSYSLAKLYLAKKEFYDNITDKYNKIEKFKKHDKLFEPDKKPVKATTDQRLDSTKSVQYFTLNHVLVKQLYFQS